MGARLVRKAGALTGVFVVKATFTLAHGAVMTLTDPKPIAQSDRFRQDDPRRSLLASSDLAPELQGAEITLVGCAHSAVPTKVRAVRMLLSRGQRSLVDKTLHVHGDRSAPAGAPPPEPAPFTSMVLAYERAYGGAGFHDNPCGVGAAASSTTTYPNVVYPEAVRATVPAGFGPIASANASRKRQLGAGAEGGLGALVMEYDERTPAAFFHAAPADQRVERLFGDERVTLVGLMKDRETMDTLLPSATAKVTIQALGGAPAQVSLALDTIQIDGDAGTASLLFRGQWPVPGDAALAGLSAVATLALPDGSIHERRAPPLPEKAPPPRRAAAAPGTVMLDVAGGVDGKVTAPLGIDPAASSRPATPFPDSGRSPSSKPAAPIPGAPWTSEPSSSPTPARAGLSTLLQDRDDEEGSLATRATVALSLDALLPGGAAPPVDSRPHIESRPVPPGVAAPPEQTIPRPGPTEPSKPLATERNPEEPIFRNVPVQEQPIAAPVITAPAAPSRPKPPDLRSKLYSRR